MFEMLEVGLEQEPLLGRVIGKTAEQAFIQGSLRFFARKAARCFPPGLQIFPRQPFGAELAIVDKNIVSPCSPLESYEGVYRFRVVVVSSAMVRLGPCSGNSENESL